MNDKRIAVIFDVDGTLIAGATLERIFIKFLWRRGELNWRELINWTRASAKAVIEGRPRLKAIKAYLRGKDSARIRRLARECFESEIEPRLSPEAINRLRWHQSAGHFVILLSGALDLLLEPLAESLGVCARVGSELEVEDGRFTGRIVGPHPFGEAKAECLATINRAACFDLKRSFAYADSFADRHLLAMVGHPVATDADARLRGFAESRGWMVENFARSKDPNLPDRTHARLNAADRLTLAYLVFSTALIFLCRQNIPRWATLLPIHLGLIAMIFGLAYARERGICVLSPLSHWYPALLFLFFFEEIGLIVHAIFPGWFDVYLIKADYAMFGVHPTVWIERFSNYWLNEYMQLVYTSYFPLTIGLGAYLWIRNRREEFAVFIASTCAAYYLCYVVFVLFPIESPHHTLRHLQQAELAGGPFTAFINLIEKHGRVHGGAFPSAHVAGAMVVLISAWRFARRAGYWLTPLVLSICVATVYGRYHYVMDVFAGILMAALGCWLGGKLCSMKAERVEL